jgi:large subunit ribosomal protein L7Ae
VVNHLFEKRPKNFRVGGELQPKRNLTRFVRWPKYILLQRQKRILLTRMKIPPLIAQFKGLDRTQSILFVNEALNLYKLLKKYSPEDEKQKAKRLQDAATAKQSGTKTDDKKPTVLKFGLQHVTKLVEEKKAKLVVIAGDVDPIELVLWLPQLCKKMDVPYCFVKSKASLGQLVRQKTATCVALVDFRKEVFVVLL